MKIASVMGVVDCCPGAETIIPAALSVGRSFNAATALVQISPPNPGIFLPVDASASSNAVGDLVSDLDRTIADNRRKFDCAFHKYVTAASVPTVAASDLPETHAFAVAKISICGHENPEIARRGRLFDIIVVAAPNPDSGGIDSAALEAALLDTGRPVLVVPANIQSLENRAVTIAWDGSREAAISIRNALPFIKQAPAVEVVHIVRNRHGNVDPLDICKYLQMHGVKSRGQRIMSQGRSVGDLLATAARDNGEAILVMGAYGDNTMSAQTFGSAVREIIGHTDLPIFLSH